MQGFIMQPTPTPPAVFKLFYGLTGISLAGFILGFGDCLFDLNKVGACADYAVKAFDIVKAMGDHILKWFMLFVQAVFQRV